MTGAQLKLCINSILIPNTLLFLMLNWWNTDFNNNLFLFYILWKPYIYIFKLYIKTNVFLFLLFLAPKEIFKSFEKVESEMVELTLNLSYCSNIRRSLVLSKFNIFSIWVDCSKCSENKIIILKIQLSK